MEEGKRFSFLYLERGAPQKDSVRLRKRLSAFYWEHLRDNHKDRIRKIIEKELGVDIPWNSAIGYSVADFLKTCELRDLLDSVTLIYRVISEANYRSNAEEWMRFVARALAEENMGYRLDSKCGVHFFVDEEFKRNTIACIAGLSNPRHAAALAAYEASLKFLDQSPQDTLNSVRNHFEAIEITYKHLVNAEAKSRLNSFGVQKELKPLFQRQYDGNEVAIKAVEHLLDGFCDWIDAAHMYRHGQKVEQPQPPPLDFTVAFISQGSSYIRLLLSMG